MKIKEVIRVLERFAPLSLQEDYDNSGLLVGNSDNELKGILISLDVNEDVVEEALQNNCNLIVSHHPLIFKGLTKITGKSYIHRAVIRAIKHDIAVYAIHTNLDNVDMGVNRILGDIIGVNNCSVLRPKDGMLRKLVTFCPESHVMKVRQAIFESGAGKIGNYDQCSFNVAGTGTFRAGENTLPFVGKPGELHFEPEVRIETIYPVYLENEILDSLFKNHPYEEVAYDIFPLLQKTLTAGSGMKGYLKEKTMASVFLTSLKEKLGLEVLPFAGNLNVMVEKIAWCGGSGSFLISDAIAAGADVFMTGDIKYHDYFLAEDKIIIADFGHYGSEKFTKDLICSILKQNFSNFALLISKVNTNPVSYIK